MTHPKYTYKSLAIQELEFQSDYFMDAVFYVDCHVEYEWANEGLNDIEVELDAVKLGYQDGYTDILPCLIQDKITRKLKRELEEKFLSSYWIDKAE